MNAAVLVESLLTSVLIVCGFLGFVVYQIHHS